MQRAMDAKVGVKPIFAAMIHSDVWVGPCRTHGVTAEAERAAAKRSFSVFREQITSNLSPEARVLELAIENANSEESCHGR